MMAIAHSTAAGSGWAYPGGWDLFGAEDAIARIAEPRQDVAVFIELPIDRRGVDRHRGVRFGHRGDALGAGQQADELDRLRGMLPEPVHRGHRRVSGGEHRVDHDHVPLPQIAGHLEVILHGYKSFRVAIKADVPD